MATQGGQEYPPGYLDEYKGYQCIDVAITFIILEVFFVSARFFSRVTRDKTLGLDDWLCLPALVCCLGICALEFVSVHAAGVGYHFERYSVRDPGKVGIWLKCLQAYQYLYAPANAFGKMSILFFYLRIFPTKWFRQCVFLVMFLVVSLAISLFVTTISQCSPVAYSWDKTIPGGHCIDLVAYFRWLSLPNIVTDVFILVLPLPLLWKLHTSLWQKVGVTCVFVVGGLGIVSASFRMAVFFQHDAFTDQTWTAVPLMIWTCIEPGVYLITACLPSFRPFFGYFIPRIWARITASKASNDAEWPGSGRDKKEQFQRLDEEGVPALKRKDSLAKLALGSLGTTPRDSSKSLPLIDWKDLEANITSSSSATLRDHASLSS